MVLACFEAHKLLLRWTRVPESWAKIHGMLAPSIGSGWSQKNTQQLAACGTEVMTGCPLKSSIGQWQAEGTHLNKAGSTRY